VFFVHREFGLTSPFHLPLAPSRQAFYGPAGRMVLLLIPCRDQAAIVGIPLQTHPTPHHRSKANLAPNNGTEDASRFLAAQAGRRNDKGRHGQG
jgi:hypothetical protein